jgi:methionyl-tRNA formyltransferase
MMTGENLKIAFWGTSKFSVYVLDELVARGFLPALIVTAPQKPKGRGLALSPSDTKVWAVQHNIETIEPTEIKSEQFLDTISKDWDLFIVASYGKIIPRQIIDLPKHGTLNVHPSFLPKLRGATPLQSAILENVPTGGSHETGVSVMLIDEEVDHGPLVAQAALTIPNWPPKESELEHTLGNLGGKLLAETIPKWVQGEIIPTEQNHAEATYTKKIAKVDAHIDLDDNPAQAYRKIQAFNVWPRAYFTTMRGGREIRVVVTSAHLENGMLVLDKVIPEGKREMAYEEFKRGQK